MVDLEYKEETLEVLLNRILLDELARVTSLSELVNMKLSSKRERSIAQGIFVEICKAFNAHVKIAERYTAFKLHPKIRLQVHKALKNNGVITMRTYEFDELVSQQFGESIESAYLRQEIMQEQYAQIFQLTDEMSGPVYKALETLVKHGVMARIADLGALVKDGIKFTYKTDLPRGNPAKGGLVKKYMAKGFSNQRANELAEDELNNELPVTETSDLTSAVAYTQLDDEMKKAIAQYSPETMSREKAKEDMAKEREERKARLGGENWLQQQVKKEPTYGED